MPNQPIIDYSFENTTVLNNSTHTRSWKDLNLPSDLERVTEMLEMIMVELSELRTDINEIKRKIDAI